MIEEKERGKREDGCGAGDEETWYEHRRYHALHRTDGAADFITLISHRFIGFMMGGRTGRASLQDKYPKLGEAGLALAWAKPKPPFHSLTRGDAHGVRFPHCQTVWEACSACVGARNLGKVRGWTRSDAHGVRFPHSENWLKNRKIGR